MSVADRPLTHATSWWEPVEGERYERGRPDYPPAAADLLARLLDLRPGARVADVAAGTGKLTRRLVQSRAQVVAVEPMPGMRAQLAERVPDAMVVAARAERLPLAARSLDGVAVAQAFHWFDVAAASAELRRVVRPGGRLALVNNRRLLTAPWLEAVGQILARYERLAPRPESSRRWRQDLEATGDWGPFSRFTFDHEQRFERREDFDARFESISYVILLAEDDRQELLRKLRGVVAGVDPVAVPLRTEIEVASRRP